MLYLQIKHVAGTTRPACKWVTCYFSRCGRVQIQLKMGRGDLCIRVFNIIKGHYLGSSWAERNNAERYIEQAWPFISPGNTMGTWIQCKCRRAQFISVCPLSAVGHGRWIIAMPALICLPKVGSSWGQGAEWGTERAEGQYWTDVRYKEGFTCRWRRDIVLCGGCFRV